MTVQDNMVNTHGVCHGGFLFVLADTAFAYALAAAGQTPVTLQASISFIRGARLGETLIAHAAVNHAGKATGFCEVKVRNESGDLVPCNIYKFG